MLLRGGACEATHRPQTLSQQYGRKCYGATRNCEAITNRKVYGSSTAFVSVIILPFLLPHLFWRSSPAGCKIKKLSWSNFLFSWAFIRFVSALLSFIQAVGRNNKKKRINATSFAPSASPDWIIAVDRAPLRNDRAYKSSFLLGLFSTTTSSLHV